jgi:alkylation response protein AidB-like acyl-CoA dehydrogenase
VRFAFSEEQLAFQEALRELLAKECTPEAVSAAWQSEHGAVPGLWAKLAEMGVVGLCAPESAGGLGLGPLDAVLLLEEAGRSALPEPLVDVAVVAVPLIAELGGELGAQWLSRLASGEATAALGLEPAAFVADAARAELLVLQRGDELHAVPRASARLAPQRSVDGARRLFAVDWTPSAATRIASGARAAALARAGLERGAVGTAAELIGLGRRLLDLSVEYARGREQFGQPIGSFQAVKHHLASALVKLELARPLVYHAAYSLVHGLESRALDVAAAKACASDAAYACSRAALQCHGAIAYTFEYPAHLWMKRVWVKMRSYGDAAWHRRRAARILLDDEREA